MHDNSSPGHARMAAARGDFAHPWGHNQGRNMRHGMIRAITRRHGDATLLLHHHIDGDGTPAGRDFSHLPAVREEKLMETGMCPAC